MAYKRMLCLHRLRLNRKYEMICSPGKYSGQPVWNRNWAFVQSACADPESCVREGPTLTTFFYFFLVEEGRDDPNSTVNGPLSARQQNTILKAFL